MILFQQGVTDLDTTVAGTAFATGIGRVGHGRSDAAAVMVITAMPPKADKHGPFSSDHLRTPSLSSQFGSPAAISRCVMGKE